MAEMRATQEAPPSCSYQGFPADLNERRITMDSHGREGDTPLHIAAGQGWSISSRCGPGLGLILRCDPSLEQHPPKSDDAGWEDGASPELMAKIPESWKALYNGTL